MLTAALTAQYIKCGYLAMLNKSQNSTNDTWKINIKEN